MAVDEAHVFPGFLTPVLTQLFSPSQQLLFSNAFAEVRGENTPERKFASTGDRTHNRARQIPQGMCSLIVTWIKGLKVLKSEFIEQYIG